MTAIADALGKAGNSARLYTLACDMLRLADYSACVRILAQARDDIAGKSLKPKAGDRVKCEIQERAVASGDDGQRSRARQGKEDLPSSPTQSQSGDLSRAETHGPRVAEGEEGHGVVETQHPRASSPISSGGHVPTENQVTSAAETGSGQGRTESRAPTAAPGPSPAQRLAAMRIKAESSVIGWLSRYRLPSGSVLFDLRVRDIRGMSYRMAHEGGARLHAAVILAAIDRETAGQNENKLIGKALLPEQIARLETELNLKNLKPTAVEWLSHFPKLEEIVNHAQ